MWGGLIIAAALAFWGIIYSLNQGMLSRFHDSRAELLASKLLSEHECRVSRLIACKGGYLRDNNFADMRAGQNYVWTYTKAPYKKGDAYLPIVVDKLRNSPVCVATVERGGVSNTAGVSPFCPTVPPAEIKPDQLPNEAIVLYQKLG